MLDTETGLQWAAADNGSDIEWAGAKRYAKNLTLGGYSDWRLPTQEELYGLYAESNPSSETACGYSGHVPPGFRFTCVWSWASDTRGSEAAGVYFDDGGRVFLGQGGFAGYRVLPVRLRK